MVAIHGYMHCAVSALNIEEMYRVIYPYENKEPGFVTIQTGDVFNLIEQIDDHWWSVHDEQGIHGLVPASYLEVNNISEEEVLCSISKSIDSIQKFAATGKGALNEEQQSILQKLIKNRQMITHGDSLWSKTQSSIPQQPKRQAPKAPIESARRGKSTKRYSAPAPPVDGNPILSKSKSLDYAKIKGSPTSPGDGASSKIYNIAISNGDIGHPPVNNVSTKSDGLSLQSKYIVSLERSPTISNKHRKGSDNSDPSRTISNNKSNDQSLQELKGKNLTITKTGGKEGNFVGGLSATNFVVSKNPEIKKYKDIQRSLSCNVKSENTSSSTDLLRNGVPSNHVITSNLYYSENSLNLSRDSISSSTSGISSAPSPLLTSSSIHATSEISERSSLKSSQSVDVTSEISNMSVPLSFSSPETNITLARNVYVPDNLGKNLIDKVRSRCKLNFDKSLAAVHVVLHTIGLEIPDAKQLIDTIREQIVNDNLNDQRGAMASEDSFQLHNVLERLSEHKEDSQQRNWAVHEDFDTIKCLLDNLVTIISEIDPSISCAVLQEDEYKYISDLIIYYQMESRPKLRISLLYAFGCFCELGSEFVTQLLCSVLPTELAMDLMQDQRDIQKFLTTCLMLTMIFSTGEQVPYNHYVQFNEAFIDFVLDTIESPPEADIHDQASDSLISMLLAFNQHFKAPKNNIVMLCIARRKTLRTLSEKVLILVNREKDPVAIFDFVKSCPDSLMKFLIDLFASKSTSGMFFTNDLMVLIDIILRQIKDRPVKDKIRTEYLSLFHSLLNTTNYAEHRHHASSFKRCFSDILKNKEYESEVDLYIVREVTNRFSELFE